MLARSDIELAVISRYPARSARIARGFDCRILDPHTRFDLRGSRSVIGSSRVALGRWKAAERGILATGAGRPPPMHFFLATKCAGFDSDSRRRKTDSLNALEKSVSIAFTK
jgi:hypothetical protein